MKNNQNFFNLKLSTLILVFLFLSNILFAQTDSTQVVQTDTKTVEEQQVDGKKKKKEKKRKDEFKVFAGVNFNNLGVDEGLYKSELGVGYLLGASYKRGKFFYWEVGARYNNPVFDLNDTNESDSTSYLDGLFSVRNVDIPITVGINFLSITSRIVGLRVFVSAVPTFALGVGGNDHDITLEDINTFNFYGQGGVGLDVTFLFLEAGFNYGFSDMFKNDIKSNPSQVFVNLGFRF